MPTLGSPTESHQLSAVKLVNPSETLCPLYRAMTQLCLRGLMVVMTLTAGLLTAINVGQFLPSRYLPVLGLADLNSPEVKPVKMEVRNKILCHSLVDPALPLQSFLRTVDVPPGHVSEAQRLVAKGTWRDAGHWPKNLAIYDFYQWIAKYKIQSPKRLVAFSDDPENSLLTPEATLNFFYTPETGENDLHSMEALKSVRDFKPTMVLLGNLFPRLHDPQLAMSNLFDVLEDGGYAFLSAPLTGVSDKLPFHFYHSTWTGLATLMNRSGFEVLEMRRWGNLDYEVEISKLNSEPKSDDLTNLQHQRFHEDFAWGLFRKSAAKYNQTCFGTSTRWLQHWAYTASETMNLWNVIEPSMRGRPTMTDDAFKNVILAAGILRNSSDFPRAPAILHYKQILRTYSNEIKAIPQLLSFGGAEYELHLGPHQRRVVDFGPYRGTSGDLHKLSLEDLTSKLAPGTAGVDFCILGQTLEHLYDPYLAVQNLFDVTAPCGFLFTSTPFANIPHMMPHHHYHYSSMGLAMLFHRAGFEVVEIGQWGSQEYLSKLFQTMRWPG